MCEFGTGRVNYMYTSSLSHAYEAAHVDAASNRVALVAIQMGGVVKCNFWLLLK